MQTAKEFVEANKENYLRDLERIVNINSVKSEPAPGAPYGLGVHNAQYEAMKIATEIGFEEVRDCEGYISYAHIGPKDKFIGVISHADVVPVGDGWFGDPFKMEVKEGYVVGRGVGDDKGPLMTAFYACKYLIENNVPLKYGIRVFIGCDEECGMSDMDYYLAHYPAPVFTFTPDSGFPVCNGEKGIYESDLVSPSYTNGNIKYIKGGMASNVVCDYTVAKLDAKYLEAVKAAAEGNSAYTVKEEAGEVVIESFGKASHAGQPFGAINANCLMLELLLKADVLAPGEKESAQFLVNVMNSLNGEFLTINGDDGKFATNSIIGGMIWLNEEGRLVLNVNSRYNTSIPKEEIESRIVDVCAKYGFTVENVDNSGPCFIDPETPAVKTMMAIFNEVTGLNMEPFVMSGGTYARKMPNAVAFGPGLATPDQPEWVGSAHMKNEAAKLDTLYMAMEIYAKTLVQLQELDF